MAEFTSAKQWKKSKVVEPADLKLPSGNVALVRAPGMEVFLQMGYIPNSLLGTINKLTEANNGNVAKMKGTEAKVMNDLVGDTEKVNELFAMVDRITLFCVEKPEVHATPMKTVTETVDGEKIKREIPDDEAKDPELLYVDEVDLPDKMFIMNFAMGGTRAVEGFRQEVAGVLELSDAVKKPVKKTKRTGGSKKKSGPKKS
jgi:hypothetical protein